MINVAKQIEASIPSRSLLMTYCASLPFFEREILSYLQQVGDGQVTLLLDDTQYQASFSDFVRGAGTRYRIYPVRLRRKSANFHAKLYLLTSDSKADLVVASANLTPSGFRANAEIVDLLTLSVERQEDSSAIAQYVAMLRLLPQVDRHLPEPVLQQIEEFAGNLERLGAQPTTTTSGPWFLHSIQDALLPQVARLIPPSEVKQIAAISPFFDEGSLAVLRLAEIYDKATIRIIKSAEPDSFNGLPLSKLGARIRLEEWRTLSDEQQRRLHAKTLVFQSEAEEWVISGSANLTRSAWLSSALSANTPGNVEAVVLRRFPLGSVTKLLKAIHTKKVDHRSLRRASNPPDKSTGRARFNIVDAQLCSRGLTILLEILGRLPESLQFRIVLEQDGRRVVGTPQATRCGSRISLALNVQNKKLDREHPIVATVETIERGRELELVRTWVSIPATLAFNATQRSVRGAARELCRRVYREDDAAGVIADAITRFLTDLGGVVHDQTGRKINDQTQQGNEEIDRRISKNEFIISDYALGALHSSHVRTAQALTGLAALLGRLLIAADEVENDAAPPDPSDETSPENDERDEMNKNRGQDDSERRKKVKSAKETLEQLNAAFCDTVVEALQQEVCERAVPFVLNLPSAAIAFVLLHAQIRRRLELDTSHSVTYDIRKILREAFSIDGMILGGSYGWLIRAWAFEKSRPALDAILQEEDSANDMLAFVAAGLALCGPIQKDDVEIQAILAGLHLVCGRVAGKDAGPDFLQRLNAISQSSGGTLKVGDLQFVLAAFSPKRLDVASLVRCWDNLIKIDNATAASTCVSNEIADLQRAAPKLWDGYSSLRTRLKPALAYASETSYGVYCQGCNRVLPGSTAQRLRAPVGDYVACNNCHRIMIPLKVDDRICDIIVRGLEQMTKLEDA